MHLQTISNRLVPLVVLYDHFKMVYFYSVETTSKISISGMSLTWGRVSDCCELCWIRDSWDWWLENPVKNSLNLLLEPCWMVNHVRDIETRSSFVEYFRWHGTRGAVEIIIWVGPRKRLILSLRCRLANSSHVPRLSTRIRPSSRRDSAILKRRHFWLPLK